MASSIEVTLTPLPGVSNGYTLEMPSQIPMRFKMVQRADQAALEATLAPGEMGLALDTGKIVLNKNNTFITWTPDV